MLRASAIPGAVGLSVMHEGRLADAELLLAWIFFRMLMLA